MNDANEVLIERLEASNNVLKAMRERHVYSVSALEAIIADNKAVLEPYGNPYGLPWKAHKLDDPSDVEFGDFSDRIMDCNGNWVLEIYENDHSPAQVRALRDFILSAVNGGK